MYWNAGSLHIYERHFKILSAPETKQNICKYYEDIEQHKEILAKNHNK